MFSAGSFSSLLPSPKNSQKSKDLTIALKSKEIVAATTIDEQYKENAVIDSLRSSYVPQVSFQQFVPLRQRDYNIEIPLPTEDQIRETYQRTKTVFDNIIAKKTKPAGASVKNAHVANQSAEYVRYTSSNLISGDKESSSRVIKIVEHAADPLQPSLNKTKKSMAPPVEEIPTAILHKTDDAGKNLTKEERDQWNIPAALSSWKNPNGYTVALDKRLAADARYNEDNLRPHEISNGFSKLSEALDKADKRARQEIKLRAEAKRELAEQEAREKEERLRLLAQKAREERERERRERNSNYMQGRTRENEEAQKREEIRRLKKRQVEKEVRMAKMSTTERLRALARSQGRDISDKVILGAAKATDDPEIQYDSRLFSKGANANAKRSEDQVYENPLFIQESIDNIYRPNVSMDPDALINEAIQSIQGETRFDTLNSKRVREGPIEFSNAEENLNHENKNDEEYGVQTKKHHRE